MSQPWIKMRTNLLTDPRVVEMAIELDVAEVTVIGGLYAIWSWADTHSLDGNALGVTESFLDRYSSVTGLSKALRNVGWLDGNGREICLVRFSEHNGATAKQRAQTAKRVSKYKEKQGGNAGSVTKVTQRALPREDKIREDKSTKTEQDEGALVSDTYATITGHLAEYARKIDQLTEAWATDTADWSVYQCQQLLYEKQQTLANLAPEDWRVLRWHYIEASKSEKVKVSYDRQAFLRKLSPNLARAKADWNNAGKPDLARLTKAAA